MKAGEHKPLPEPSPEAFAVWGTKVCSLCKTPFPDSLTYFSAYKNGKHKSICRQCRNKQKADLYRKPPSQVVPEICTACGHDCELRFTCSRCAQNLNVCFDLAGGFRAYNKEYLFCSRCAEAAILGLRAAV